VSMADVEKQYKSPVRKLLPFFERSRNGWKQKCKVGKAEIKRLKNKVEKLGRSRQHWKEVANQHASEIERLRRELEAQKLDNRA
jgi:peptidoglycan hydrolase CwlO-like protein